MKTELKAMAPAVNYVPLYWLAVGTFAVGTEAFMIAAILPKIAKDVSVSLQVAGQLVTIFALTYAVTSPVLTALTGGLDRRKLLILAMTAFAAANLVAASASGYWSLAGARFLLAVCAGIYTPSATALAGALVPPERRGLALAIVTGGTSLAVALGVPLGALIGFRFGWRMTFVAVAVLSFVALAGLVFRIPHDIGKGLPSTTMRTRIAVVRQTDTLSALFVTTLWGVGTYANYTYIAPLFMHLIGFDGAKMSCILFLWGTSACVGLLLGGLASDRIGDRRVISFALLTLALALFSLSLSAWFLTITGALVSVLVASVVWGFSAWAFFPAQQSRLIKIAGTHVAPVVLSLNASFMYLGFSCGALLGSLTLTVGKLSDLGWVGALCELVALIYFLVITQNRRTQNLNQAVYRPSN
jgi:predicted MFS family arabinose efflux permease